MRIFLKILLSIIAISIMVGGCGIFYITRGLDTGEKVVIEDINLSSVNDGIYKGKYNAGRWSNEVNVTVKDHKITKIDVVKDVTISKQEVKEEIIKNVIEKQNTNVDVVSGATVTSKAYLKSMENAFKK